MRYPPRMERTTSQMEPRKPWLYHAIINTGDPSGVHLRVSVSADSFDDAKAVLENEYGAGTVISLWGEVESQRPR